MGGHFAKEKKKNLANVTRRRCWDERGGPDRHPGTRASPRSQRQNLKFRGNETCCAPPFQEIRGGAGSCRGSSRSFVQKKKLERKKKKIRVGEAMTAERAPKPTRAESFLRASKNSGRQGQEHQSFGITRQPRRIGKHSKV